MLLGPACLTVSALRPFGAPTLSRTAIVERLALILIGLGDGRLLMLASTTWLSRGM